MTPLKTLTLTALMAGIALPTASFADDDLRRLLLRGHGGKPVHHVLRDDDDDKGRRFVHSRRDHRDGFRHVRRGYFRDDDDDDRGRRRGRDDD